MKKNLLTFIFLLGIFSLANLTLAQDPNIPDTIWIDRLGPVNPSTQVVLNIWLANDETLGGFSIPLRFPDTVTHLDITCDSMSFVGTRSAAASWKSDTSSIDNDKNRLAVYALFISPTLPPGNATDGPIAKLYFTTGPTWDPSQVLEIDTTLWPPNTELELSDELGENPFQPAGGFGAGALEVREVSTPTKPKVFSLSQNYPNPFNPTTIIMFGLPKDSWVKLEIYNVLGQRVRTLVDEKLVAGLKEVEWDGRDENGYEVSSGIYFYRIKAEDFSDIKKMVLLK